MIVVHFSGETERSVIFFSQRWLEMITWSEKAAEYFSTA